MSVDAGVARRPWQTGVALVRLSACYVALAGLKHFVPVRTLARWMWLAPAGEQDVEARLAAARRVIRVRRVFNRRGDCLESSLLFYRELSKAGANPVLCLGLDRRSLGSPGHSWVEVDGQRVAEGDGPELVTVVAFGPGGQPVG